MLVMRDPHAARVKFTRQGRTRSIFLRTRPPLYCVLVRDCYLIHYLSEALFGATAARPDHEDGIGLLGRGEHRALAVLRPISATAMNLPRRSPTSGKF